MENGQEERLWIQTSYRPEDSTVFLQDSIYFLILTDRLLIRMKNLNNIIA